MYVITYKNKPATLDLIYKVEYQRNYSGNAEYQYIAAKTKKECVEIFLYHIGYTWKERSEGIDCKRVKVAS